MLLDGCNDRTSFLLIIQYMPKRTYIKRRFTKTEHTRNIMKVYIS
jgi:hypothetical protein